MAALTLSVLPIIPSQTCKKPIENSLILKSESLSNSFIGTKLSIQSSNFSILAAKRRSSTVATVLYSLPTGYNSVHSHALYTYIFTYCSFELLFVLSILGFAENRREMHLRGKLSMFFNFMFI